MGAKVHLDTSQAHAALDALIEKAEHLQGASVEPAKIVQAKKRWERRNGESA